MRAVDSSQLTSIDGARRVNVDGPEGETIHRDIDTLVLPPRYVGQDQGGNAGDPRCQENEDGPLAGGTPRLVRERSETAGSTSTPILRQSDRQCKPPDRYSP